MAARDIRKAGAFDLGFGLGTDHPRLGWSARGTHRVLKVARSPLYGAASVPTIRDAVVRLGRGERAVRVVDGGVASEFSNFVVGVVIVSHIEITHVMTITTELLDLFFGEHGDSVKEEVRGDGRRAAQRLRALLNSRRRPKTSTPTCR